MDRQQSNAVLDVPPMLSVDQRKRRIVGSKILHHGVTHQRLFGRGCVGWKGVAAAVASAALCLQDDMRGGTTC